MTNTRRGLVGGALQVLIAGTHQLLLLLVPSAAGRRACTCHAQHAHLIAQGVQEYEVAGGPCAPMLSA